MGKSNKKMLSRTDRIQLQTKKQVWEHALQQSLVRHNTTNKPLSGWIKQLQQDKLPLQPEYGTSLMVIAGLYNQIAKKELLKRKAFDDLLVQLEKQNCHKLLSEEKYLKGIYYIAQFASYFIQDVNQWKKVSYQPEKQFAHLLRFLFANYPVPLFLDKAWLEAGEETARKWFIDIASGLSVRKLQALPVPLTKRMAHFFLWTPAYWSISGAFRFAQVIALGGDEWLAWHLNATLLGRNNFRNNDFWLTVIRFFVEAPLFDARRLEEVVNYINHQRLAHTGYSLKGRTPDSLLRQVEEWQQQMNQEQNYGGRLNWKPSGFAAFEHETGSGQLVKIFKVRELLSSNELRAEGKSMKHCVYTYVRSCHAGQCSIFSLTADTFSATERLVTIEVDIKRKQIVQAKARLNEKPSEEAMDVMKLWAEKVQLSIAKYIY
ncbi:hypothetical protein GXP67_08815 [Rhodocytophaga rosea]|uniref:PcfJ domain-containing protein n=1 Tax=Rhodocytophaga rosea TaxID=2704465 RepID=A0A6C0GFZ8_9BACT|nr:PcfJ domain-containing protein [Rhodocytophaga rosea]QHT66754.1 hypothetical protein GXP67_08815 [Rhodocytophaga rosea]